MRKKLKILAAADLHGSLDIAKILATKGEQEKVDLVVLAGDLSGYHEMNENILEPFNKIGQKVLFVPGNWDFDEECEVLREGGKSIHNYYVTYKGVGIVGIGSPNWKMSLDSKDFERMKKSFSFTFTST